MSRSITSHMVNPANDSITITVLDEPGSGGANHAYVVGPYSIHANPSIGAIEAFAAAQSEEGCQSHWPVVFQNGPIAESGINGLTPEILLAILIDRLEGFQSGPYASADNAEALTSLQIAQTALQRRTRERMARGVEGTHQV